MKIFFKAEKFIFYLFIYCIPFQTRLVLSRWSPLSSVNFNEWTSAFLYLTDLFILVLLGFWLIRIVAGHGHFGFRKRDAVLVGFLLASAVSITQSAFPKISWYQFVKLAEFIALFFYIKVNRDKIFGLFGVGCTIFISGIFQSVIAIAQYIHQASLGLRWLGESPLHLPGEGIASFYSVGRLILRPYGTLPHPNILAAFLFVALTAFSVLYLNRQLKSRYWLFGYAVMLYAFFLTFSRTVIAVPLVLVCLFSLIAWFNKSWRRQLVHYKSRLIDLGAVSVAVILIFLGVNYHEVIARVFFAGDEEAISLRLFYNKVAGQGFLVRAWLGSGIGTFVSNLMALLPHVPANIFQPVHNLYLLILAETGLLGFIFWGLFIKTTFRGYIVKNNFSEIKNIILPFILWTFLFISLFDHFFWTLQQGRLLLWLVLALLV